jgi:hypothetical protein
MIKVSKPEYDFFRKGSDPEQQNCSASSLVSIFKDALGRGCEGCEEAMQKKIQGNRIQNNRAGMLHLVKKF